MYCKNCGSFMEDNAAFCGNCGSAVNPANGAPNAPYTAPAAPVYEAPAAPVYEAPAAPVYEAPAAPVYEAPAAPVYEAPAAPYTAPAAPVYEAPAAAPYAPPAAAPYSAPYSAPYAAPVDPYTTSYYAPTAAPTSPELNSMSVKLLVFGILGLALGLTFYFAVAGIVFSAITMKMAGEFINRGGVMAGKAKVGHNLAKAGLPVSIVMTAVLFILIIAGAL